MATTYDAVGTYISSVIAANGDIIQLEFAAGASDIALSIVGTFSATVQFEAGLANLTDGITWTSVDCTPVPTDTAVTSTTAEGSWQASIVGFTHFRFRCSVYTSGRIYATVNAALAADGGGIISSGAVYQTAVFDSATSIKGIAPGTAGQVLTSGGASTDPSYQDAGGISGTPLSIVGINAAGNGDISIPGSVFDANGNVLLISTGASNWTNPVAADGGGNFVFLYSTGDYGLGSVSEDGKSYFYNGYNTSGLQTVGHFTFSTDPSASTDYSVAIEPLGATLSEATLKILANTSGVPSVSAEGSIKSTSASLNSVALMGANVAEAGGAPAFGLGDAANGGLFAFVLDLPASNPVLLHAPAALPTADGQPFVSTAAGVASFAQGGTFVQASDPGGTLAEHIGRQWFDTTTTTTVFKVCVSDAGVIGWKTVTIS